MICSPPPLRLPRAKLSSAELSERAEVTAREIGQRPRTSWWHERNTLLREDTPFAFGRSRYRHDVGRSHC